MVDEMGEFLNRLVEKLNSLLPPDDQLCNTPLNDPDCNCHCSLNRLHGGPHITYIDNKIKHTWTT